MRHAYSREQVHQGSQYEGQQGGHHYDDQNEFAEIKAGEKSANGDDPLGGRGTLVRHSNRGRWLQSWFDGGARFL